MRQGAGWGRGGREGGGLAPPAALPLVRQCPPAAGGRRAPHPRVRRNRRLLRAPTSDATPTGPAPTTDMHAWGGGTPQHLLQALHPLCQGGGRGRHAVSATGRGLGLGLGLASGWDAAPTSRAPRCNASALTCLPPTHPTQPTPPLPCFALCAPCYWRPPQHFDLVEERELSPLQELIEQFTAGRGLHARLPPGPDMMVTG